MSAASVPNPVSANVAPRRPRRRWRWLLFSLGILGLLAAITICVVQVVLWSSTPRNLVMTLIEQKLGIRAGASTLSTTWFGRTTLTEVRFALPLADQPFVTVPRVVIHHRWLTALAVTQDIGIRTIELDHPTIWVRRDALGRWNLQDLIDTLNNSVNGSVASAATGSSPLTLPSVTIIGATVNVSDASGKTVSVDPIDVVGTPRSAVTWGFTVNVPNHLSIDGLLAPGGDWRHQLKFNAHDVRPWIAPWIDQVPASTAIGGNWAGQLTVTPTGPSLSGLLMLSDVSALGVHASGSADATVASDSITIQPRALKVTTPSKFLPTADVVGGVVQLAGGNLTLQDIGLQLLGGPAKFKASYNLDAGTGSASAAWDRIAPMPGMSNSGTFTASLTRPFPQQLHIDTAIDSSGAAPGGAYFIKGGFAATGSDWRNFAWQINAASLDWQRVHRLNLSGLQLAGRMHDNTLTLDSVTRPADPGLVGYGWYNFYRKDWSILIAGQAWPFHPAEGVDFAFHLDADGDQHMARLHDFSLRPSKNGELVVTGNYTYSYPKPVSFDMQLRHITDPANPSLFDGTLRGSAHLSGTIWPRNLLVVGQLRGSDLAFGPHQLGAVALRLTGTVTNELADIQTERLSLLGGKGDLEGIYSFSGDALDVGLTVSDLSLAQAGRLLGRRDCTGTVGGHWHIFLPGLSLNPNRVRITGLLQATDAAVGNLVTADQIDAQTTLENGTLRVQPITMLSGKTGNGSGDLAIDLSNPSEMRGSLALTDWPVEFPQADGKLSVNLSAPHMVVDLPSATTDLGVTAPRLELEASATLKNKPAGHIQIVASSSGRVADLQKMQVSLLNGTLIGQAHLDIDQFSQSTANITWKNLDTAVIASFVPALDGLSGRIAGSCVLVPATGVLALEPVAMHLQNVWTKGRYKTIKLNRLRINGFVNSTPQYSRIVLADDPDNQSQLAMADGTVSFWARFGMQSMGPGNPPFDSFLAQVGFTELNFDQLIHVIFPEMPAGPGLVGGNFMLLANSPPASAALTVKPVIQDSFDIFAPVDELHPATAPARKINAHAKSRAKTQPALVSRPELDAFLDHFYGEAHANITDSDLVNFAVFQALYNLMHISFNDNSQPMGYGDIDLRLESGNLAISNLRYFNRGTEIDALGTVSDVANIPDCKVTASAIGTTRPLSQIKLPLFSDVDTILTILQQGLTSVLVTGTVRDHKITPALFKDLGSEMRSYLLGNAERTN